MKPRFKVGDRVSFTKKSYLKAENRKFLRASGLPDNFIELHFTIRDVLRCDNYLSCSHDGMCPGHLSLEVTVDNNSQILYARCYSLRDDDPSGGSPWHFALEHNSSGTPIVNLELDEIVGVIKHE